MQDRSPVTSPVTLPVTFVASHSRFLCTAVLDITFQAMALLFPISAAVVTAGLSRLEFCHKRAALERGHEFHKVPRPTNPPRKDGSFCHVPGLFRPNLACPVLLWEAGKFFALPSKFPPSSLFKLFGSTLVPDAAIFRYGPPQKAISTGDSPQKASFIIQS